MSPTQREHPDDLAAGRRPLRTVTEAWEFLGDLMRRERHKYVAIAQGELRRRGLLASVHEADDVVLDAVTRIVAHVADGTATMYANPGILVSSIRQRALHVQEKEVRRRTDPHAFDVDANAHIADGSTSVVDEAVNSVDLDRFEKHLGRLVDAIREAARNGDITQDGWEAMVLSALPERPALSPALRQRASRTRKRLWPVIEAWIEQVHERPEEDSGSPERIAAILHGTGLVYWSWNDLVRSA